MKVGYVPGVWDMFHIGHLNILLRARAKCDKLVVGVVPDEEIVAVKKRYPIVTLVERMAVLRHMDIVDEVYVDAFPIDKLNAWKDLRFDIIFKGDDWRGTAKGEQLESDMASVGVELCFFPYTAHTSSTLLRSILADR